MTHLKGEHLRKTYRRRRVVDDVSVEIAPGEVVGLLGPNGAGKTTTFYLIVGLLRAEGGRVMLGEDDLTDLPMHLRARRGLSYLPQEPSAFRRLTVAENVLAVLEIQSLSAAERRERLGRLLEEMGIDRLADQRADTLSGGERRRLEISRALALEPRFMLLDEPFAGVDPIAVADLQGIVRGLKGRGIGVLISDHNVRETLGVCDRAYILGGGKILEEGTPKRIASSPKARAIYLGEGFQL